MDIPVVDEVSDFLNDSLAGFSDTGDECSSIEDNTLNRNLTDAGDKSSTIEGSAVHPGQMLGENEISNIEDNMAAHDVNVNGDSVDKHKRVTPPVDWQSENETLSDSLRSILENEEYSDVTFLVGERRVKIKAHKLILMTRSAVFDAMFQRWELGERAEVTIEDADPLAFKLFIMYLYTGNCDLPTAMEKGDAELIVATLHLGHKYNLKGLVTLCTDAILKHITAATAAKYYSFGSTYDIGPIKKKAMAYIRRKDSVFASNDVLEWDLDTLTEVLSDNNLTTSEANLFQAVIRWAKNTCKMESLPSTVRSYRNIAEKAFLAIRYPLMTFSEFTDLVVTQNEGLFSDKEIIQIYRLLSTRMKRSANLCHEVLTKTVTTVTQETSVEIFHEVNCNPRVYEDSLSDSDSEDYLSLSDSDDSSLSLSLSDASSRSELNLSNPTISQDTFYGSLSPSSDEEDDTVSLSLSTHSHMSSNLDLGSDLGESSEEDSIDLLD